MKIGLITRTAAMAEALRRALALQPDHRVSWAASTGIEAILRAASAPPDIVLLDVQMTVGEPHPITRLLVAASPCPILLVSHHVGADTAAVFEAMGQGALDAVDVPTTAAVSPASVAPLLKKIATLARLIGAQADSRPAARVVDESPDHVPLVAIGASAGGPAALATLLRGLPRHFPAAIVIVQHVDARFAGGMATWLTRESGVTVAVAADGDRPRSSRVLMAGSSQHLILRSHGALAYTAEPRNAIYCPSIDVFFHSVQREWRGPILGVLLTGMGRDGAAGLKALRSRGHHTIAQDEATSAVYGMPRAAVELGGVVDVLPTDRIARRLTELLAVAV